MKKIYSLIHLALIVAGFLQIVSCVRNDYEGPPDTSGYDPQLIVTSSIAQLLSNPQGEVITEDIVISGTVTMDDKNGNYYKKIVLEDSSAGIEVELDQSNLYNDYPVGRKVYIKCKGLYLGTYGGMPQLGFKPDKTGAVSNIPALLISDFIVKANYPNAIVADTVTIAQLSAFGADKYLNRLIVIKDVEFTDSCTGIPYAEMASLSSATSLTVHDCNGKSVSLRTSAFAKFQPYLTPGGNGTLSGIFTKYNNSTQIYIRDTNDVHFTNVRCDGSGGLHEFFSQDFTGMADDAEIALSGWTNFADEGGKKFTKGAFQSDSYAKITAYGGVVPPVVETWLITPSINLAGKYNVKLSFKTKDGFDNGATLKAYISTDYSGSGSPTMATWIDLAALISAGHTNSYATNWTVANVHLNYNQLVYIAFKYEGGGTRTTTFELGYIKVTTD